MDLIVTFCVFGSMVLVPYFFYLKHLNEKYLFDKLTSRLLIFYPVGVVLFLFNLFEHSLGYKQHTYFSTGHECYSPISGDHLLTFLLFIFLNFFVLIRLLIKENRIAPLMLSIHLAIVFIGIVLNSFLLIQVLGHNVDVLNQLHQQHYSDMFENHYSHLLLIIMPLLHIVIGVFVILKVIRKEQEERVVVSYKNKLLNAVNVFLIKNKHFGFIIIAFPLFVMITIVLLIFGQKTDSVVKMFTETTTWMFSNYEPPEPIEYSGHYLCTVAAHGSPQIVKPVGFGKRQGRKIIINRQLQIANAFEEWVQEISPKKHTIIRKNYDKYGLDLSKTINSQTASNIVYWFMKPLELFFLMILYLFVLKPEEKINKQYRL